MGLLQVKIQNKGAASYKVYYRLRGSSDPWAGGVTTVAQAGAWTTVTYDPVTAGEYETYIVSICADGSQSTDSPLFYSKPCPVPTSFNVTRTSPTQFTIDYGLPPLVTQFNLRVQYPNGGTLDQVYIADGSNQLVVPVPSGQTGDFIFSLRSVCSTDQDWYSAYTPSVLITIPDPSICAAPFITSQALTATASGGDTWRFTLAGQTTSVRVVILNTTLNTTTTLTQPVTGNYIDLFLERGAVNYQYTITIYNICAVGTDAIGDVTDVEVPAAITTVDTAGWTVNTAPETVSVGGVFGWWVTVNTAGTPPSPTQDTLVNVRYDCSGGAQVFAEVIINAGLTSGNVRHFNPACSIDPGSAFIQSAVLV